MNWLRIFWRKLKESANQGSRRNVYAETANFTPRARKVVDLAEEHAARLGHPFVGTEHLLLGLIELGQGVAFNVLKKFGLDLQSLSLEVEREVGRGPDAPIELIGPTPQIKRVIAIAGEEAATLHHTYIGTEHFLLGIIREGQGVAARVLEKRQVNLSQVREKILSELEPNLRLDEISPNDQAQ